MEGAPAQQPARPQVLVDVPHPLQRLPTADDGPHPALGDQAGSQDELVPGRVARALLEHSVRLKELPRHVRRVLVLNRDLGVERRDVLGR